MPTTLPTVHLNGTGIDELIGSFREARFALERFSDAFDDIVMHPRDYYPQGENTYKQAFETYYSFSQQMEEMRDYLDAHIEHLEAFEK